MSGLGIIGIGLAWLNFRNAKAEYEDAKKDYNQKQAVADAEQAAALVDVNNYQDNKYDQLEHYDEIGLDEQGNVYDINDKISGVTVVPILNVKRHAHYTGKAHIKKYDYVQIPKLVFINESDRTITIHSLAIKGFVYDKPAFGYANSDITLNEPIVLAPTAETVVNVHSLFRDNENIVQANKYITDWKGIVNKGYLDELFKAFKNAVPNAGTWSDIPAGTVIKSIQDNAAPKNMLYHISMEMIYSDNVNGDQRRALYEDIAGNVIWNE
jgi:hypothetical protein